MRFFQFGSDTNAQLTKYDLARLDIPVTVRSDNDSICIAVHHMTDSAEEIIRGYGGVEFQTEEGDEDGEPHGRH